MASPERAGPPSHAAHGASPSAGSGPVSALRGSIADAPLPLSRGLLRAPPTRAPSRLPPKTTIFFRQKQAQEKLRFGFPRRAFRSLPRVRHVAGVQQQLHPITTRLQPVYRGIMITGP